jgi:hypothetical protein
LPANLPLNENDIVLSGFADNRVAEILKTSCYDCHSNQVNFPWYARIAPASWLLARDINQGREELNFSEWNTLGKRSMIGKLEAIQEEISSGAMPLPAYTLIHRDAKLTAEMADTLNAWTKRMTDKMLE